MKVRVKSWRAFEFFEVFRILEFKDGCVFRTERTGKYIKGDQAHLLSNQEFQLSSVSTRLTSGDSFEIDLVHANEFLPASEVNKQVSEVLDSLDTSQN